MQQVQTMQTEQQLALTLLSRLLMQKVFVRQTQDERLSVRDRVAVAQMLPHLIKRRKAIAEQLHLAHLSLDEQERVANLLASGVDERPKLRLLSN